MYKAIFFDRDGTLTYDNPEKTKWRDQVISEWSQKPFTFSYEKQINLFIKAAEGKKPWYKNVEDEKAFMRRYYYHMLKEEGIAEDLEKRAEFLFSELWCNNDKILYPETIEVLEYFKQKGYKMGVISDTSPSLQYSLERLGIAKYFTSFTASSLVGASKPSPIIFNVALRAQNVKAEESIFVDDTKSEADGARELGFTSFWLDRSGEEPCDPWTVRDLRALVKFVESL